MSTRTTLRPAVVIAAGDMSAASITSAPTILQSLTRLSYALSWTGTSPVGTVAVQVSNDYKIDGAGKVIGSPTWNTLPLELAGAEVMSIPVSGNTGNGFIDIEDIAAYAVQLVYTKVSGTGTLIVTVNGKVA